MKDFLTALFKGTRIYIDAKEQDNKKYVDNKFEQLMNTPHFNTQFKWADKNPNKENRSGLFVTINGEEISIANNENYTVGVVTSSPEVHNDGNDDVCLIGVATVRDDGTCKVNGYCKPIDGGIATASELGFRVIKRVSESTIKIIFLPENNNIHKFTLDGNIYQ